MDGQMPGLDGYAATARIRASPIPAIRDIKIIALTASAIQGDKERCIAAGMNSYLAKVRSPAFRSGSGGLILALRSLYAQRTWKLPSGLSWILRRRLLPLRLSHCSLVLLAHSMLFMVTHLVRLARLIRSLLLFSRRRLLAEAGHPRLSVDPLFPSFPPPPAR